MNNSQPQIGRQVTPAPLYREDSREAGPVVSLADVKSQLRLDPADASQDAYLTILINSAERQAEKMMNLNISETTFTVYNDQFYTPIELRKAPFISVTSVKYYINGVQTLLPATVYETPILATYAVVKEKDGQSFPQTDVRIDAVEIIFKAGITKAKLTPDLQLALLQHVAFLYENRGDCDQQNLPAFIQQTYRDRKIISLWSY